MCFAIGCLFNNLLDIELAIGDNSSMRKLLVLPLMIVFLGIGGSQLMAVPGIGEKLTDEVGIYYQWEERSMTMNLRIISNQFYLFFIDEDGMIVAPPVDRAALRYEGRRHRAPRTVSERDPARRSREKRENFLTMTVAPDGATLTSTRYIRAPLIYWVTLTLQKERADRRGKFERIKVFGRTQITQIREQEERLEKEVEIKSGMKRY